MMAKPQVTPLQYRRARHRVRLEALRKLQRGHMRSARSLTTDDGLGPSLSVQRVCLQLLVEELEFYLLDVKTADGYDSSGDW